MSRLTTVEGFRSWNQNNRYQVVCLLVFNSVSAIVITTNVNHHSDIKVHVASRYKFMDPFSDLHIQSIKKLNVVT